MPPFTKTRCGEDVMASNPSAPPCSKAVQPWVLVVTILGSSMAFIDSTVVNVALPAIQKNLSGTVIDMQWVVEGYALLLSALILLGGSMGDLFGRRRTFLGGVFVFGISSAACGLAPHVRELVTARIVQGFGAALLVPASLAIISASFDEQARGRAIGTWSGFTAITTAIGPVLGGWLVQHGSWRWAFFINLPIAAAVVVLSLWRVPESRMAGEQKVDWTGATIVTMGLAGVTYGFIESGNRGWHQPSVWGTVAAGCAALIAFVYIEHSARSPMVPLDLFRSRDFSGGNLLTLFLYAALGIFFFLLPLNLIQVQRYSATATGAAVLPFILLISLLSRWSGGLVARYGARRPLIIGPIVAAAGFLLFALPSVGGKYWTTFFPAFMVLGLGMAISVAPLTTVVMDAVDQKRAGTASGVNNAVARVAGLLAIAILGLVMVRTFSNQMDHTLARLDLPAEASRNLQSNEIKLAGMPAPAGLDLRAAAQVRTAIDRAFIFAFRRIMLICAALALASAAVSWRMITGNHSALAPK